MKDLRFFKGSKGEKEAQNGFTLLEVLLAMAIFAIGILGVAGMQISATHSNATARRSAEASEFGQTRIETLMSLPYTSVLSGSSTMGVGYWVTWTVANTTNPTGLTVQVQVRDPQGDTRCSYVFNRYPNVQ